MNNFTEVLLSSTTPTSGHVVASGEGVEKIKYVEIASTFFAIFLVGIVGNALVIYILFRQRHTWNVTTTYLFNLSLADAVFVCTLPLWAQTYLNHLEWTYGNAACKTVAYITGVNMYASIFFLVAMSVDRWLAVVHSTSVGIMRNSTMARSVTFIVWACAGLLSIPRLVYQTAMELDISNGQGKEVNSTVAPVTTTLPPNTIYIRPTNSGKSADTIIACTFWMPVSDKKEFLMGLMEFMQALIGFVFPMIIITACYSRILITVKKKLISNRLKKERVAMLAALIIAAFFICWLPDHVMNLYSSLGGWWNLFPFSEDFYHRVYPFCVCIGYANSCINPFIYAFTATNFKNNVKEVCRSSRQNNKITAPEKSYKMAIANCKNKTHHQQNKNNEELKQAPAREASPEKIQKEQEKIQECGETSYETYEYYSCPPVLQGIFKIPSEQVSSSALSGDAYSMPEYAMNNNGMIVRKNEEHPIIEESVPLKDSVV